MNSELIDAQIAECHRQIEAQTERLPGQAREAQSPEHSRLVLLCLKRSLMPLTRARATLGTDERR